MKINYWQLNRLTPAQKAAIIQRGEGEITAVMPAVEPILAAVHERGDAALIEFAARFEQADISAGIKVTDAEFDAAYASLPADLLDALRTCAGNVITHHRQQMARVETYWLEEIAPGVLGGEKVTPIPSVGIYVPRGKGAFPSMMYMLCAPARIAGVPRIAVCTPPMPDGTVDAASLVAADLCGVRDVYKVGGAQAIAALAYGTETVPRVAKVEGPGSPYVSAAKRMLSSVIDPGMPAGASDSIVLADATADAWNCALDLMNEAEHGPDSASVLVTDSLSLSERVAKVLPDVLQSLPPQRREFCETVFSTTGGVMLCDSMDDAIAFCNEYAPEHLLVKTSDPEEVVAKLTNAGEILIGESTPMVLGNFGIGVNAVLPTGGRAATHSCTSVWSFLKRTSISRVTAAGYHSLKEPVTRLARYEGFDGHAMVLTERNEKALD
ncbi:MAG: histidinol dehydrogenase [Gammaproteobacteria bacterium]|nr:histidinol dehydrogenase [Gammaproteobacteria bacterium]